MNDFSNRLSGEEEAAWKYARNMLRVFLAAAVVLALLSLAAERRAERDDAIVAATCEKKASLAGLRKTDVAREDKTSRQRFMEECARDESAKRIK